MNSELASRMDAQAKVSVSAIPDGPIGGEGGQGVAVVTTSRPVTASSVVACGGGGPSHQSGAGGSRGAPPPPPAPAVGAKVQKNDPKVRELLDFFYQCVC